MWESESESHGGERGLVPVGGGGSGRHEAALKNDGFVRRDRSWYVNSDIPSDLLVKVGDVNFYLHKYPMISRSGRMSRAVYESAAEEAGGGDQAADAAVVEMDDLPGRAESFELAARFCYGMAVDLTAANISGLRCAAEYLEMTEEMEEGNLIFKTEAFLSYVVLSSWRDSIVVLKSCEALSPWAENLQIVRRCSESIAWKACANPRGVRWAYTGTGTGGGAARGPAAIRGGGSGGGGTASPRWNVGGVGGGESKESSPSRQAVPPADWWFEDVSDRPLRMRFDLIGAAITHYASKWLPGLTKDGPLGASPDEPWAQASAGGGGGGGGLHMMIISGAGAGKDDLAASAPSREQRMVVESIISITPPQRDSVSCGFLLRLLRLAIMLKAAPALVTELEKRVGMQLEQAALADLLIPSYGRAADTAYDVDLVQRLVEHFLVQEQTEMVVASSPGRGEPPPQQQQQPEYYSGRMPPSAVSASTAGLNAKARVARLLDSYLSEVSRDRNLSLTKFQVLAESLPESARTCDDGLYRAVDSYLKAHPTLTEHERKRLCRVMDCQKLSFDACMHAAQNERLPLRVVVQVLFSEQVKISNALASSSAALRSGAAAAPDAAHLPTMPTTRRQLLDGTPQSFQEGWAAAKKDINTLKFELESMKAKYLELQHEMDALQKQVDRGGAPSPAAGHGGGAKIGKQQGSSAWSSGWKKLGRLAKMSGADAAAEPGGGMAPGGGGEAARKGPRRWRNSIS
uniref:NPH3 domain-containing protein n=1 Tax=Oryza punctata TaxID=4537 RepID=A0A0E0K1E0_ORYPU